MSKDVSSIASAVATAKTDARSNSSVATDKLQAIDEDVNINSVITITQIKDFY